MTRSIKSSIVATVLVGAFLPAMARAVQEPAPAQLDRAFFAERRQALMKQFDGGVILLRGAAKNADNSNFYQDHEFYYLTGVVEPDLALLMFPAEGRELLLVPPFNRFTATWDGARLVPGEAAAETSGFAEVGNVRRLRALLDEALAADESGVRPKLWTLRSPAPNRTSTSSSARAGAIARERDALDGRSSREEALCAKLEEAYDGLEIGALGPAIDRLRGIKTPEEIRVIRLATQAACQGIAEAIKSVEPGMYEYQVAAVARYVFSRLGAGDDAYAAIVGGGPNGCVLHYSANQRKLLDDDLIVMDYGPTVHGYATDVTRTFPASGKFSPEQRKLVEDVQAIQIELIGMVKPGEKLRAISRRCSELLIEKGYRSDHGPCHHVGLAVHDIGGGTLEPGMVITVEPGAYLRDAGMGCRIEDVVLVTADGCEVLSAQLPRDPDGIEALAAQRGIAQQPVGLPGDR